MQPRTAAIFLLLSLAACTPRHTDSPSHAKPAPTLSLKGWASETIALPPDFAPELPSGSESLLFAPGWRNPDAEGFWSYAFVMSIDEPVPDASRLRALLERYYNGLMAAFAEGQAAGKSKQLTPVSVEIVPTGPNRYSASMRLTDAFATFRPIKLRVLIDTVPRPHLAPHSAQSTDTPATPRSLVRIRLSPQPPEHPIWQALDVALESIPIP